jgi:hypothetical protein
VGCDGKYRKLYTTLAEKSEGKADYLKELGEI